MFFQGELIGGKFGQAEPLLVFGILSVIAGLLLLLLPETYGRKLPDTMQEGEDFGRYIFYNSSYDDSTRFLFLVYEIGSLNETCCF